MAIPAGAHGMRRRETRGKVKFGNPHSNGSLGGEPWRSVFGLCLFFTRRILNILSLFNKRVRSPKQLCSVADTTQHPDLIQVVEGFTSPHDRS